MGGKTKQTQRIKNNSRPSNSGRSAELFGATLPTFVGFTPMARCHCGDDPILPAFSATTATVAELPPDEIDAKVDFSYQLVLRKMTKKDATTRVKALQEFTELVNRSDMELVISILPYWPRLYQILSADVEHRIREACQQAHAAVSTKCGKKIAPHLRQLAPTWIISQFDIYAPAASIANESFQRAFRPLKQQEVFSFCQNEILEFIIKNVTVLTPTSQQSSTKTYLPGELEVKYQQIVSCSLKGYAQYLSKMPEDALKEAAEKNAVLIENPKFWNFHKNTTTIIRAAWFEALAALLQYAPHFLAEKQQQLATTCAIHALDESEPIVLPHVWSAILLVTQEISNWFKYVNIDKALLPKLWKVLKGGGNGNAAVIHPNMLPLLAKLNQDALTDVKLLQFYTDFFKQINVGLSARSGQQSRSDVTAIATAYYECLQYVCIQIQRNEILPAGSEELLKFCTDFVQEHLVTVIEWCFTNELNCAKHIFPQIARLVNYWTQNSTEYPLYGALLKHFWQQTYVLVDESLEKSQRIERILEIHLDLVQSFRCSSNRSKSVKVKFSNMDDDETDSIVKPAMVHHHNDFNELAFRLCAIYIMKATESLSPLYINNLENLLKSFGAETFFQRLGEGNIAKLYDKFSVWLLIAQLRQENVVDIILLLYPFLETAEKQSLLMKLIKFANEQVQTWIIGRLLSHPLCTEPNIAQLLSHGNVKKILLKCAKSVTEGDTKENINFLHKCFFQNESGDILIDADTCKEIVECIAMVLTDNSRVPVLDGCASFLAQIMPVICTDEAKKDLRNFMFLKFFEFSVNKCVSDDLTEDTLWEITTSWQDALSSNDLKLDDTLLQSCSDIIDLKMHQAEGNLAVEQIENVAEIVSKLILCSIERIENEVEKYARADEVIDNIFNYRRKEYHSQLEYMEHLCKFLESINGQLTVPDIGMRILGSSMVAETMDTVYNLIRMAVFKFNVISKVTCSISKRKQSDASTKESDAIVATNAGDVGDDECTEDFCDVEENLIKCWSDNIFDEILDGIYVATLGSSMLQNSSILPLAYEFLIISMEQRVNLYLRNISTDHLSSIKAKLFAAANEKGSFWAMSTLFLSQCDPYKDPDNGLVLLYEDAVTTESNCSSVTTAYANILQSFTIRMGARLLPIVRNLYVDDVNRDDKHSNILVKSVALRCLIQNYSHGQFNETEDRRIVDSTLALLNTLYTKSKNDKSFFLYNEDISNKQSDKIILITEVANLYSEVIRSFPNSLSTNEWDLLRIAVSSWVLTVSKSSDNFQSTKVAVFIVAIYKLFYALSTFIGTEKIKSSTKQMTAIIEEWDHLFAKDVNLILLKCYLKFVTNEDANRVTDHYYIEALSRTIHSIDFQYVLAANRIDSKTSMDDLITFALKNLGHRSHSVRMACVCILKKLAKGLIAKDMETMLRQNDSSEVKPKKNDEDDGSSNRWHLLHKFEANIRKQNELMDEYSQEFSFKSNELDDLSDVPALLSIPYMLLWDCILDICSKSVSELRSTYAAFLTENNFVQPMLLALFRLMPVEILRSQDSKAIGQVYFTPLTSDEIRDEMPEALPERYACHMYILTLRHLPAAVRKWWHDSMPAQKTLVDKVTTSYVSAQLCQDELRGLIERKEKHENMQTIVHTSTREVIATYSIDEARMELIVTLPVNHPLGAVKVESGKQIGGRLQSRVLVMQLTIFLTHQNGSISDGLSLWKRNLDRKFEGVQECYVCYSVIHQDTCQLPKLTCRKCKNKFHGPCLYKWFSTSNKSTCPICRNIF